MSREYILRPYSAPADFKLDYPRELNPQQLEAVTAPPGPALVLAGAGAGKTRTLIYRVAFLLEQGIPPECILLLTFTNKASREMMQRVEELLGGNVGGLWGGTFHSIGNRILRRHAERIGYPVSFNILDRDDSCDLIQACVDDLQESQGALRLPKPDLLAEMFSLASNTRRTLHDILKNDHPHFEGAATVIDQLRNDYQTRKQKTAVMDFDDLLCQWLALMERDPELLDLYQRRFQFILVDEFQDTNQLQADLIDLLAARHQNVMAVGDDSQSIYSWRGANFENILKFPDRYPGTRIYKIETNYRSTPEILAFANAAISPNLRQFKKELVPARSTGTRPVVVSCPDSRQQAAFVAQRIIELHDEGVSLRDVAVLYRSHFHALELQLELSRRRIPFSITSGLRFFEQAHIKDITAHLKWMANPLDEISFKRMVRLLPGIGGGTSSRLWTAFSDPSFPTEDPPTAPEGSPPPPPLATRLQALAKLAGKRAQTGWAQFTATIAQAEAPDIRNDAGLVIQLIMEATYQDYLEAKFTNHRTRREDIEQLASFASRFESASDFLAQVALATDAEPASNAATKKEDQEDQIKLSTIHQAKGLEFGVVFVIMLCDGLFPSERSLNSADGEEEERRLFYVAVTRAKNELYLCHAATRETPGRGFTFHEPSRFLNDVPEALRETWDIKSPGWF